MNSLHRASMSHGLVLSAFGSRLSNLKPSSDLNLELGILPCCEALEGGISLHFQAPKEFGSGNSSSLHATRAAMRELRKEASLKVDLGLGELPAGRGRPRLDASLS